jgi:hypothetical protein
LKKRHETTVAVSGHKTQGSKPMPEAYDKPSSGGPLHGSERSPEKLFGHIRQVFTEIGALNHDIALEYEGIRFKISCNDSTFMVYRINDTSGPCHHMPGWPVCLVSSEVIFEECASPGLAEDHCACSLDVETWLQMVRRHCRAGC